MSPSKFAPTVPIVYLALGSNLGDRRGHLCRAVAELRTQAGAEILAASALYATEAVGIADGPEFLNAAIGLRTALQPEELLDICLAIEQSEGRVRGGAGSPNTLAALSGSELALGSASALGPPSPRLRRTSGLPAEALAKAGPTRATSRPLDLDLLIWGDETRNTPELILPHPRLHERAFVLAPLSEIAPDVVVRGRSIAAWAAAVGTAGVIRQPGTEDWARSAPR